MRSDRRHPFARRLTVATLLVLTLGSGVGAANAPAATISMTPLVLSQMNTVAGIACASATSCVAAGDDVAGNPAIEAISSGQPGAVTELPDASFTPMAIACPGNGRCLIAGDVLDGSAAGQTGAIVPITGGVPGATESVSGTEALSDLACSSSSTCTAAGVAADGNPATVTLNAAGPGTVGESPATGFATQAIACPVSGACDLAGNLTTGTGTSGAVAGVSAAGPGSGSVVPGSSTLAGIACPALGPCIAVGSAPGPTDSSGNPSGAPLLVTVSDGHPGSVAVPSAPAGGELTAVGCPPQGACVALGDDGAGDTLVTSVGAGGPGPVQALSADQTLGPLDLSSVACPSATACLAVGQDTLDDPVLARISPPAGAPGTSGGSAGGSGGSGNPSSGRAGGSSPTRTGADRTRIGGGHPRGAAPRRARPQRPRHGSGHRQVPGSRLLTRLRLTVTWPTGSAPGTLEAVLRLQSQTGAGLDGVPVALQVRKASPGATWRTIGTSTTRSIGGLTGEARFSLVVAQRGRVVLRAAAAAGGHRRRVLTQGLRVSIL